MSWYLLLLIIALNGKKLLVGFFHIIHPSFPHHQHFTGQLIMSCRTKFFSNYKFNLGIGLRK